MMDYGLTKFANLHTYQDGFHTCCTKSIKNQNPNIYWSTTADPDSFDY
jgi:hypothetical protein